MKKELAKKIAKVGAKIFTHAANNTAQSACLWGVYQPKEPKMLQK